MNIKKQDKDAGYIRVDLRNNQNLRTVMNRIKFDYVLDNTGFNGQLFEFEPDNYIVRLKKLGLYYAFATAFYTGGANTKDIELHLYCSKSTSNWIKEATYSDSGISDTLHVSSIIRNDDVDNNIGIFATAACWNGNYGHLLGSGSYTKLEIAYLGQYLDETTE